MPSDIMDQRDVSASSRFYEEIRCTAERKNGFWKPSVVLGRQCSEGMVRTNSNKLDTPTSVEKPSPVHSGISAATLFTGKMEKPGSGGEGLTSFSKSVDSHPDKWSSLCMQPTSLGLNETDISGIGCESSLFSSSLSTLFTRQLRILKNDVITPQPTDTVASTLEEVEPFESLEEIEAQTIGNLLPDEDDLFSGVIGEAGHKSLASSRDDLEDFDLFSSGGGMELEGDDQRNGRRGSNVLFVGEHPRGEHPSRTLFVQNMKGNVEDSEIKDLFQQYGDIRTLYTACKHRGFVIISYYDIRAAQNAIMSLQNKLLRHWKLDIHYYFPKNNPSEEDIHEGTLVVSNLDSSVSNEELCQIFGAYGEIKKLREATHMNHQKLIEFYDVRAAEAALCTLKRSEIAGKEIKIERSCPRDGFDSLSSTNMGISPGIFTSSSISSESISSLLISARSPANSFTEPRQSCSIPVHLPSSARVMPIGKPTSIEEPNHSINQCMQNLHPHSFPEYLDGFANGSPYKTSRNSVEMVGNVLKKNGGFSTRGVGGAASNGHQIGLSPGAFGSPQNGNAVHGNHQIWNNNSQQQHSPTTMIWPHSPSGINGFHAHRLSSVTAFPRAHPIIMKAASPVTHHIGSAHSVTPSLWDNRHAFVTESLESSSFYMGSPSHPMDIAPHNVFAQFGGNPRMDMSTISVGRLSPHMFSGRSPIVSMPASFDTHSDRVRNFSHRRSESSSNNADKKHYELDIDRILLGEDSRTTLMLKNIPNKYTSKMLLAAIDEHCKGTYDFIYLPIDFKNKCNVGYAFINMIDPQKIIPFHKAFNGKKWEKFNSEKVASLAYARIQGKTALIAHFQNSSLMNEDKRCRPILFHTNGPNAGDQEPFPVGTNTRLRSGKPRTINNEENYGKGSSFSSSSSANKVEFSN